MQFFVDRPVFATVIALIISLVGLIAVRQLAIEQYPNVAPPQVAVTATYPGASPELLENVVAAPLEREMNGVSGLLYMESTSSSSGLMQLKVVFEPGTDLDLATVEVNNRVKRVEPLLPQVVLENGVRVDKTNPALLLIVTMQSKTGQFDAEYLSNLANSSVLPEIKRIGGVGDVTLFGYPYAMRIWLNPDQLAQYRLTVADVSNAIREQNQNYAVGEIGTTPSPRGQVLTFPVQTTGTLVDPSQFADIIVRAAADGSVVRVRDVARVELGSEDYQISLRLNGQPATGLGIYLRPGGNALATADQVRAKMTGAVVELPERRRVARAVRHDGVRQRVDRAGGAHVHRGVRARADRRVPVPRQFPGDDHPDARHPGVAGRHHGGPAADGLLDQHADAVRPRAGDRHRGRRRDRGGRGGREDHARQGPRPAGRRARGDEGHRRRHRRRDRRDLRGVRAGGLPRRRHRNAVQAVRDHDHHLDPAVGGHGADADAGAVRADPEAGHAQAEADPGLRPVLREGHAAVCRRRRPA